LIDCGRLIRQLISRGITPIISHPDRHQVDRSVSPRLRALLALKFGAFASGNLPGYGSGSSGPSAERAAWQLLEAGLVSHRIDAMVWSGRAPWDE